MRMHGLINRTIQQFVCDTYGVPVWEDICARIGLEFTDFEAMLSYEKSYISDLLTAMADVVGRPRASMMEDLGTYLVTAPGFDAARRLLRFGGVNFVDFLHSLDDLPDRVRLAVSDLYLPALELHSHADNRFSLRCMADISGYGHVMMGILRVMADDYGALAWLDHAGGSAGVETISISLVAADFAEGRHFDLGARAG
tara:strand:+ start:816 stop:1409 length:594 start_codon:yes stop_codon:yes gene_type:complete